MGNWQAFALLLLACAAVVQAADPPVWPSVYQVEGNLQLPYAEIDEPFTSYYNATGGKSQVNYYGTMVLTIQLVGDSTKNKTDYGKSYKVAPMATEQDLKGKQACFLVPGTNTSAVVVQSVLPDLANFTDDGTETVDNVTLNKWSYVETIGCKKNNYTMWVQLDKKGKNPVPVRYMMMGYDTLLGSHYDKYYLDYKNYKSDVKSFPDGTFEVPKDLKDKCGGFPGPGQSEHRILINPMQEYIQRDDSHVDDMFDKFKKIHKKGYPSDKEHQRRKDFFKQNLRYIHSMNRAGLGYTLAVNHLADMKESEIALMRGLQKTKGYNGGLPFYPNKYNTTAIPDYVDWRLYGAVTPVKDQAVCGSCWSFGTTGTLEGALFLKTGKLVRLSQQELVDCSWGEDNNGCDGGEDFRAYQYIIKNGLQSEETYGSYLGQDGYCHKGDETAIPTLKGYINVTSADTKDIPTMLQNLKLAIAQHGPISIGIDASVKSFSFYSNGVYYDSKCGNTADDLDHAVLAVGYGVLNGSPYWLVKNSWSTYWGNDGYVLMSWKKNNCGAATSPTFVLM